MTISPFPTPTPSRDQSQDVFDSATEAFLNHLPTFVAESNAVAVAMNLNSTTDTSASSNAIGTGAKTFTVTAGKSFQPGMWLVIADTAAPTTNGMFAQVMSYSGTTLVVNSYALMGSGTKTAWVISQSAPAALEGLYAALAGSASQTFSVAAATAAAHAMRLDQHKMPSGECTQAGGALTFTSSFFPLTFPSATLTSGAATTIVTAAADLVLPSGGILGFTSGVQGRIVVAEMNNGGTREIAICNQAGGLQMDEENLISTTAIADTSDAANVWYSTTARTDLPYKIVMAVDVVNTAGAWGNPVLVRAAGGNALTAMASLGYGGYTNTSILTIGTTYYNTQATPIFVIVRAYASTVGNYFAIDTSGSSFPSSLIASPNIDVIACAIVRPYAAFTPTNKNGTFATNSSLIIS